MRALELIADDRVRGASEIADKLIAWAETWGHHGDEPIAEVRDGLEEVARSQSALAPVLRIANDLLVALEPHTAETDETVRSAIATVAEGWRKRLAAAAESLGLHIRRALENVDTVYTYSSSGTIRRALIARHAAGEWFKVVMSESRPGGEGARMAATLAERGIPVELGTDAWLWTALDEEGVLMVGADALLAGVWVNKIGTRMLAERARDTGIRTVVAADTSKWLPSALASLPRVYDRDPGEIVFRPATTLTARNIYFEEIPYDIVDRLVTERGVTRPADLRAGDVRVANQLA